MPSGRTLLSATPSSKSRFVSCEGLWAMIRSLLASLKPHIAEAIASSVRSPTKRAELANDQQIHERPFVHGASSDSLRELSDATKRCRGCDAGSRRCLRGERQIVFVTGEAGIGKTALVDAFAHSIASDRSIRIGRGQCLEQYGTGEAYLPVLEAIGRLCREQPQVVDRAAGSCADVAAANAFSLSASDRELLSREVSGATRERMLREMGEALEALTADLPLVLILEDLHWSDYSTLDLISYLARQRQPAQLMLIGTYRNSGVDCERASAQGRQAGVAGKAAM